MATRTRQRIWAVTLEYVPDSNEDAPVANLDQVEALRYVAGQRELSEEGYLHWQLCVAYSRAVEKSQVQMNFGTVAVEPAKNGRALYYYCTRADKRLEGTPVFSWGELPKYTQPGQSRSSLFRQLRETETRDEADEFIQEHLADYSVLNEKAIGSWLNRRFHTKQLVPYPMSSFKRDPILFDVKKTAVMFGLTGLGKTSYALAHFAYPVLISDKNDFGKIRKGQTDGLVIDDMQFRKWSPHNLLHLCDYEHDRSVNIKYSTAEIPANLPRIFTINVEEDFWPESINEPTKDAILRRVQIINVHSSLFQ